MQKVWKTLYNEKFFRLFYALLMETDVNWFFALASQRCFQKRLKSQPVITAYHQGQWLIFCLIDVFSHYLFELMAVSLVVEFFFCSKGMQRCFVAATQRHRTKL